MIRLSHDMRLSSFSVLIQITYWLDRFRNESGPNSSPYFRYILKSQTSPEDYTQFLENIFATFAAILGKYRLRLTWLMSLQTI